MVWGSDITRRALVAIVAAATLVFPAQASAAGAGVGFGVLGIASGSESANITVTRVGGSIVVTDPTQSLDAGLGCSASGSPAKLVCPADPISSIGVVLLGGNDRFDSSAVALPANVSGGDGSDRITTGSGADSLNGGAGNDVFATRDGTIDSVDCGSGADSGEVDSDDALTVDCEPAVERPTAPPADPPAVAPPAPEVPPTQDPVVAEPPADAAAPVTAAPVTESDGGDPAASDSVLTPTVAPVQIHARATIALSAQGDILVPVECAPGGGSCKGTIELIERDGQVTARTEVNAARRRKAARKEIVLGRQTFALRAGQKKNIRIRLARNGRQRIIKKKKKRKTRARLVITMRAADGTKTTIEKNVTISPPKERRTAKRKKGGSKRGGKKR